MATAPASPSASLARRRWFDRRTPLPAEDAQHRTNAYIYGNLLVLATVASLAPAEIIDRGVLAVLGITVSTFLAHSFAGMVSSGWTWPDLRRVARDSAPILTSGALPALILASANLGFPSVASLVLADLLLIVRIALIGVVAARLRHGHTARPTVLIGVAIAFASGMIVLIKLAMTG